MEDEIPFQPISAYAHKLLDDISKKKSVMKTLNKKLFCVCLGPSEVDDKYILRKNVKDYISKQGHISFFPEEITKEDLDPYFDEWGINEHKREAILGNKNLLNELLFTHSDLIFLVCSGRGVFIELGKVLKIVPHKARLLVSIEEYEKSKEEYEKNDQLGMEIKCHDELHPKCVLTYDDDKVDILDKINRCLIVELRRYMRGAGNE